MSVESRESYSSSVSPECNASFPNAIRKISIACAQRSRQIMQKLYLGDDSHSWKIHMTSWKNMCKPKINGGPGIRRAVDMNKALLSKVNWRMLKKKGNL